MVSFSLSRLRARPPHYVEPKPTSLRSSSKTVKPSPASFDLPPSLSSLSGLWSGLSDYQREAVLSCMKTSAIAFIHDQGVGKTVTTLALLAVWHAQRKITEALIVCPLSVLPNWQREHQKWCPWVPLSFTTYQRLGNQAYKDCVVVDELQYIKTRSSKRSRHVAKLAKATYRVGLTGTPIDHNPAEELWAEWRFINPDIFGTNWGRFRNKFLRPAGFMGYECKLRVSTEKEFWRLVALNVHHLQLKDVLKLPPSRTVYVRYPPTKTQRRLHDELMNDLVTTLSRSSVSAHGSAQVRSQLFQLVSGYWSKEPPMRIASYKPSVLARLVRSLTGSFVVFYRYKHELVDICSILEALGITHNYISGGNRSKRQGVIDEFTNRLFTALVAQVDVGGVGLNLQVAETAVFYSRLDSRISLDQARARIYRRGQEKCTTFYVLECKLAIDEILSQALHNKRTVIQQMRRELKQWRRIKRPTA